MPDDRSTQTILPLVQSYNQSYLVSLVKNINWTHVFWELTNEHLASATSKLGTDQLRKVLRVFEGDLNHQRVIMDITIESDNGSRYVYLQNPGQKYQMEIVLIGENGSCSLVRSNLIQTPPGTISSIENEQWAAIDELYQRYAENLAKDASSPPLWQISSPMGPLQHTKFQGLELSITTDLLLYGKATPGSKVYVQGEEITTSSDGSFQLRYALSEGTLVLPIKAVSVDGRQTETIVPVITRETY